MKIEQVPGKPPRFPPPAAANIARAVHNLIMVIELSCAGFPRTSAPDSGVIFHAAAVGLDPHGLISGKSEEKLHLKDSHQTRTGRAQRGP